MLNIGEILYLVFAQAASSYILARVEARKARAVSRRREIRRKSPWILTKIYPGSCFTHLRCKNTAIPGSRARMSEMWSAGKPWV